MKELKRKLPCNQTVTAATKKLRNQSISSLEHFSNELIYEIFDYLDSYDIYKSFVNLNHHFEQLLDSATLLLHVRTSESQTNRSLANGYQQFLAGNQHKIASIRALSYSEPETVLPLRTLNCSFVHLKFLLIESHFLATLVPLLTKLRTLPALISLTIRASTMADRLDDIYRLVLALPVLQTYQLDLQKHDDRTALPWEDKKCLSSIEHLTINHSCTPKDVFFVLTSTPQLRSLDIVESMRIDRFIERLPAITLSRLTTMSLSVDGLSFSEFEIFIKQIGGILRVLYVSIRSSDVTFLNGRRWERFILQHMRQLKDFTLRYYEQTDKEGHYPVYCEQPNQFTSAFWLERRWLFESQLNYESIEYLIRPCRKRWNGYLADDLLLESARLTITDGEELNWTNVERILSIAQIYHLEIVQDSVDITTLIEVVQNFPDVKSLKIHSLFPYDPNRLDEETLLTLSLTDETSQITHVYLQTMKEMHDFDFLLELCPYMEYLKVDCVKYIDFKFVLRYILRKVQMDCNEYLRSFSFRHPMADDEWIKQLRRMIAFERLLAADYTIQRQADNIHIQWK